jgi:hypothetical protein
VDSAIQQLDSSFEASSPGRWNGYADGVARQAESFHNEKWEKFPQWLRNAALDIVNLAA